MLTFDTSKATMDKKVKIDGTVYTVKPLGGGAYMRLLDKKDLINEVQSGKLSGSEQMEKLDELYDIIRPLISPTDEFAEWEKRVRSKNELAYVQVMSAIMDLVVSDNDIKKEA